MADNTNIDLLVQRLEAVERARGIDAIRIEGLQHSSARHKLGK